MASNEIDKIAEEAKQSLFPSKSKTAYLKEYKIFLEWLHVKGSQIIDENSVLAYIYEMAKVYKPNTLWSIHSKMMCLIKIEKGIDISKFSKVQCFLRQNSKEDVVKKSSVFNENELNKFFTDADDSIFLLRKASFYLVKVLLR